MPSNSKRRQLSDDDIDLLLGSSDGNDSDLDPCYLENDGDISYDSNEESGSNLRFLVVLQQTIVIGKHRD